MLLECGASLFRGAHSMDDRGCFSAQLLLLLIQFSSLDPATSAGSLLDVIHELHTDLRLPNSLRISLAIVSMACFGIPNNGGVF